MQRLTHELKGSVDDHHEEILWWKSAVRRVPLFCALVLSVGSCDRASAVIPAQVDSLELILTTQRLVEAPTESRPTGVGFSAEGKLMAWSAAGDLFAENSGHLVSVSSPMVDGLPIRGRTVDSVGRTQLLLAGNNEIRFGTEREIPLGGRLVGELLSNFADDAAWDLLVRNAENEVILYKYGFDGSPLAKIVVIPSSKGPTTLLHFSVATFRTRSIVISTGDSLSLLCLEGGQTISNSTVASAVIDSLRQRASNDARWTIVSILPLDHVFAAVLSDLRSDERVVALTDSSCRIIRVKSLPNMVIPLVVGSRLHRIVASDYRARRQFMVLDWRWGAQNSGTQHSRGNNRWPST